MAADAGGGRAHSPPPPLRMVVALLGLAGLLVSLYLLAHSLGWVELRCGVGDCGAVQSSRWARLGPVPVPALGVLGYTAILGLATAGVQPRWRRSRAVGWGLVGLAAVGTAFSAWLTWLEAAVIRAWCPWCVISAVLMAGILVASLPELRPRGAAAGRA